MGCVASDEVLGAANWNTNADLLVDGVAPLGYINFDSDRVLDCTWGHGTWWNRRRPANLTATDLDPTKSPYGCPICGCGADHPKAKNRDVHDGTPVDYRALPFDDCTFDAVAYDPAYTLQGGKDTSTLSDYNERYGRHLTPGSVDGLRADIAAGLGEVHRVLRPGGRALVKCANYVWSAKLRPGVVWTFNDAETAGFELADWFTHVGRWRPQPERTRKCRPCGGTGERLLFDGDGGEAKGECIACEGVGRVRSPQQHARQNSSTLFVFERIVPAPERSLFNS